MNDSGSIDSPSPSNISPPSIQDFPQEVFELVVEQLDEGDLLHCHSVCRSWWRLIRPYLFSTVTISDARRLPAFTEYLEAHTDVGRLTQCLILDSTLVNAAEITTNAIARVVRRLPRLSELYILGMASLSTGATAETDVANSSNGMFPHALKKLYLSSRLGARYSYLPVPPLLRLLSLFQVDELHLSCLAAQPSDDIPQDDGDVPASVSVGHLNVHTSPQTILQSLSPALTPGVLRSFGCGWIGDSQSQDIGEFLRVHGPGITELTLCNAFVSLSQKAGEAHCECFQFLC